MHSIPVVCGRVAMVLFLILAANGCEKKAANPAVPKCGDKTVNVNTNNGAEPEAVYVCEDDTVTWNPNGLTFVVEFKKDSPFKDDDKHFDNAKHKSQKTKHHDKLKVYEYRITVNGVAFDPQVIGGGGN